MLRTLSYVVLAYQNMRARDGLLRVVQPLKRAGTLQLSTSPELQLVLLQVVRDHCESVMHVGIQSCRVSRTAGASTDSPVAGTSSPGTDTAVSTSVTGRAEAAAMAAKSTKLGTEKRMINILNEGSLFVLLSGFVSRELKIWGQR
jgi:hypothetical protein